MFKGSSGPIFSLGSHLNFGLRSGMAKIEAKKKSEKESARKINCSKAPNLVPKTFHGSRPSSSQADFSVVGAPSPQCWFRDVTRYSEAERRVSKQSPIGLRRTLHWCTKEHPKGSQSSSSASGSSIMALTISSTRPSSGGRASVPFTPSASAKW